MGKKILRVVYYYTLLLLCIFAANKVNGQCNNWSITKKVDSATCAANGVITVTLTGADAALFDSVQYSLKLLGGSSFLYERTKDRVLPMLKPGNYQLTVNAVCQGYVSTKLDTIKVPGSYVDITAVSSILRGAIGKCPNGQIRTIIRNGRRPYHIYLENVPTGYTGRRDFYTGDSTYVIDSLPAGNFTVRVIDDCSTSPAPTNITMSAVGMYMVSSGYSLRRIVGSCDKFVISSVASYNPNPEFVPTIKYLINVGTDTLVNWNLRRSNAIFDTIQLPVGTDMSKYDRVPFVLTLASPCGDTIRYNRPLYTEGISYTIERSCDNINLIASVESICLPTILQLVNKNTGEVRTGTAIDDGYNFFNYKFTNIPYGDYRVEMKLANRPDIIIDTPDILNVSPIPTPYYRGEAFVGKSQSSGRSNVSGISIIYAARWTRTPNLKMVYPVTSDKFDWYSSGSLTNTSFMLDSYVDPSGVTQYFTPGYYLFRVTDSCGVWDVPVMITSQDVFNYKWDYELNSTCQGQTIKPLENIVSVPYSAYAVTAAPDNSLLTTFYSGSSYTMTLPGRYQISRYYPYELYGGIGVHPENTIEIYYNYTPVSVDIDSSKGWVCPGAPANSGQIRVKGINGSKTGTKYMYKLAALGNGENGPYLDSNYTGSFSSNSRYQLVKNSTYSVKIIDNCNAFKVQDITILDFANYQIASADKPLFCKGDYVRFQVINLPTSAVTYLWTFPSGKTTTAREPVISRVSPSDSGIYHVKISSDMCQNPLEADVPIHVAPYVATPYSLLTDTSVNPYVYGMLGNWRAVRSYIYYTNRAEESSSQQTNIRKDGTYKDYQSFWKNQSQKWMSIKDTTKWVWNAESTIFNTKGLELETVDPLGRYNSIVYGYDNTIPIAVIQNSRYRNAAYDGFEDYDFLPQDCQENSLPPDRRFDLSKYKNLITAEEQHTGKNSIKIPAGDTVVIRSNVVDAVPEISNPTFTFGTNNCTPATVLKSVRTNANILIPPFAPLSGDKMVFSAWVKEAGECNCTTYSSNKITLYVAGAQRIMIEARPVGVMVDGWQRYEQVVSLPKGSTGLTLEMIATKNTAVYVDDIRFHPYHANMKSYAYDPMSLKMMAELDENNYATFYEYDDDGTLIRVKKETEKGIVTLKESRNGFIKEIE